MNQLALCPVFIWDCFGNGLGYGTHSASLFSMCLHDPELVHHNTTLIFFEPFPTIAAVCPSVKFRECEPMPERSTTYLESCHALR